MLDNIWILVAVLLLVPTLVVGFVRFGLRKERSHFTGLGGVLFAAMTFAAALWIIFDKVS